MMSDKTIITPLTKDIVGSLNCGDAVLLTGIIYTARDAAHSRMIESIKQGEPLPFPIENAIIYYVGPTPEKSGQVIGSAGPTTSGRMDIFTPDLISAGLSGMIGKGMRSPDVVDAMCEHGAVYFGALGGAGALLSQCIISSEVVAYDDLGTEAIRKLEVKDMPLTVIIDSKGDNLYTKGRNEYLQEEGVQCRRKD